MTTIRHLLRSWPARAGAAALVVFLAGFGWLLVDLLGSIPGKAELKAFSDMPSANVLYDIADREVFTIAKEQRIEIPLSQMSPVLVKAVIAIEDRRFWDHDGFDPIRIIGSAIASVRAGEAVQGGSTITQQLARQSVGREKTLQRKLKELLFAAQLEHHFSKEEILALYLNKVYFGDGLYGVEAASRGYFGKSASELNLGEAALLAGLLKAPSTYDPTAYPEKAEARQAVVLKAMLDSEVITKDAYDRWSKTQVEIYDGLRSEEPYGRYFKEEVRRQLVEMFGAERVAEGGLQVFTTIDPGMQRAADAAVDESIAAIEKTFAPPKTQKARSTPPRPRDPLQAALIAIDPATGYVRAMVGGRDFKDSSYNRATRARRQPGSAFKPFIFSAAIEAGYGPDDLIEGLWDDDIDAQNVVWMPDDDHVYEEDAVTLRQALRMSSNRATVRLLREVGLGRTVRAARGFGFEDLPVVPSVALGSGEVTLNQITAAYGAFANRGAVFQPTLIRKITDRDGKTLFTDQRTPQQAIKPVTAYLMADMLRGVIEGGTAWGVRQMGFTLPAGGKTGTTNDYRDAWFIGFTPNLVTGVWVGFDQPQTIRRNGYAAELAVPLWTRFMKDATKGQRATWIERPRGVIRQARAEETEERRSFWSRVFGGGRN
ncbi:MAG TPA: PBP1A family penicillin-binding protein [Vicinamibacterales bacterium]|nr:PBP1A family penicillin-binding protein [Vicinamibacterales bacterium]